MHHQKIMSKCKKLTPSTELSGANLCRGFVELYKRVLNLNLAPNRRINFCITLHKKEEIHEILFDICFNNTFSFLSLCIVESPYFPTAKGVCQGSTPT